MDFVAELTITLLPIYPLPLPLPNPRYTNANSQPLNLSMQSFATIAQVMTMTVGLLAFSEIIISFDSNLNSNNLQFIPHTMNENN